MSMVCRPKNKCTLFNQLVFILFLAASLHAVDLESARRLFYASVDDGKKIDPAIRAFTQLADSLPGLHGRMTTYIGALEALRGKHALLPHAKYRKTLHGLKIMDQGLEAGPEDIEALFIHSSTCFFLPFFFKRSDDAQRNFKTILRLLPDRYTEYEPDMMRNVIDFLAEKAKLNAEDRLMLAHLRERVDRGAL